MTPGSQSGKIQRIRGLLLSLVLGSIALAQLPQAGALRGRQGGDLTVSTAWSATAAHPGGQIVLAVVLEVPAPLHINRNRLDEQTLLIPTVVQVEAEGDDLSFLKPQYPDGETYTVDYGAGSQTLQIYQGRVVVYVGVNVAASAPAGAQSIRLKMTWQACDDNLCYPPVTRKRVVRFEVIDRFQSVEATDTHLFVDFDPTAFSHVSRPDRSVAPVDSATDAQYRLFGSPFGTGSTVLIILLALAAGVVLNFTPCVLPVVPLKIMSLQQHAASRSRTLALGVSFSLGIVACFALLGLLAFGLVAGVGSKQWGQLFSYWWFAAGLGCIVGVMGLGMMGLFATRLPQFVYTITPRHDRHGGSFLFGALTAVLSTPCTGPFLAGSMGWAVKQPALLGLLMFICVGIGMALPYMLLLLFPGWIERIPRTGPASALIKQLMGLLLLAVAIYFIGIAGKPLWGGGYWWAVAAVIAIAMCWLMARTWVVTPRWGPRIAAATIAVLLTCGSAWVAAGRSIDHVGGGDAAGNGPWRQFNTALFDDSVASGKTVIVEFTADWCINCLVLESQVLADAKVVERLKSNDVVALRVDLTSDANEVGWGLLRDLGFTGIPLTAVYQPEASTPVRLTSLYTVAALLEAIGPESR